MWKNAGKIWNIAEIAGKMEENAGKCKKKKNAGKRGKKCRKTMQGNVENCKKLQKNAEKCGKM